MPTGLKDEATSEGPGEAIQAFIGPRDMNISVDSNGVAAFVEIPGEESEGDPAQKLERLPRPSLPGTVSGSKISLQFLSGPDQPVTGWKTAELTAKLKTATTPEDVKAVMTDVLGKGDPIEEHYEIPAVLDYLEGSITYTGTKITREALPVIGGTYGPPEGEYKPMTASATFTLFRRTQRQAGTIARLPNTLKGNTLAGKHPGRFGQQTAQRMIDLGPLVGRLRSWCGRVVQGDFQQIGALALTGGDLQPIFPRAGEEDVQIAHSRGGWQIL